MLRDCDKPKQGGESVCEDPHGIDEGEVHTSESDGNGSTPDGSIQRGNAFLWLHREGASIGA